VVLDFYLELWIIDAFPEKANFSSATREIFLSPLQLSEFIAINVNIIKNIGN
jgi:hypothetical protein